MRAIANECHSSAVHDHPAVRAWLALDCSPGTVAAIETLKPSTRKSYVCRLHGARSSGAAVIAKRCRTPTATLEQRIYDRVLSPMPFVTLTCFGYVPDADGETAWLFVEDAGDRWYDPTRPEHRTLAGRWLARLHTSTFELAIAATLPERGLEHHLSRVRLARETVLARTGNPAFTADDRRVLDGIIGHCDRLEAHWAEVTAICGALPSALVHGDFGAKNLRLQARNSTDQLLPFDWEMAGFGLAAADLSQVDERAYWEEMRGPWPVLTLLDVGQISRLGRVLWCLDAIPGERTSLAQQWVDRAMGKLRFYAAAMDSAAHGPW